MAVVVAGVAQEEEAEDVEEEEGLEEVEGVVVAEGSEWTW